MKTKVSRRRDPVILCPHCEQQGLIRSSVQLVPTCRELRVRCDNDDCGHVFVVELTVTRTILASRNPRPSVHLPFGAPRPRIASPANDDLPVPANDIGGADEAAEKPVA